MRGERIPALSVHAGNIKRNLRAVNNDKMRSHKTGTISSDRDNLCKLQKNRDDHNRQRRASSGYKRGLIDGDLAIA